MKKTLAIVVCLMMFYGIAFAGQAGYLVKGRYVTGEVNLPIGDFMVATDSAALPFQIDSSSKPGLEYDDYGFCAVWADSETTPAYSIFEVPSNYNGDGFFRVLATESAALNAIDFDVFHDRAGDAIDATATDETAVSLTTASFNTPSVVILTPTDSDFQGMQAGDWVTLRIWRNDDSANGTGDLEVRGVTFVYTPIGY